MVDTPHQTTPVPPPRTGGPPLLELRGVSTVFRTGSGDVPAVDDVTLSLDHGRVMAIIGESGSGKSALLRTILGIQPSAARESGEILLEGRDLLSLSKRARADTRGRLVSMVFQDPMTALDPVFTVERQLVETLRRHLPLSRGEARKRALELLELVQIPAPESRLKAYPFEMSGGMRQRVVIAMALACEPAVLLADEPTTALDVTVQAKILDLIREIQREREMGVLIVTHDLAVAAAIADDVGVMYAGRLVEYGPVEKVILDPGHPYTRGLLAANVLPGQQTRPRAIPGSPPSLQRLPPGCSFAPRCDVATVECWERQPPQVITADGTWSRCLHADELVGRPLQQAGPQPHRHTTTTPRENSRVRT